MTFSIGDRVVFIGCNHTCPGGVSAYFQNTWPLPYGSHGTVRHIDHNDIEVEMDGENNHAILRNFTSHFISEFSFDQGAT